METTLLATKLFVPPLAFGLVQRSRLLRRLDGILTNRLTLVSAPAGFGKTTLLSEWVHYDAAVPAAWLSLEEAENDPVRFWDYLIAAIRTLEPGVGEASLHLLHSSERLPAEPMLTPLINEIAGISRDWILVLDDYHLIKNEAIHAGVAFLLEHLPPRMHVVVATRSEPHLPLPSFRGRGTLLEIGADDLRFTVDEASAFLRDKRNLRLTPQDVSALHSRTEGWAAGLSMAALSMDKQRDSRGFISRFTGSQRYVTDYLIDEVLKRQPDDVRDFLLKTSVLDRLTGPLCDHLLGRTGSQTMLENLEKANLFVVPLDESRQWFRYHHLFGELLRQQLQMTYGQKEAELLHGRASQWYEGNGFPDDSVHHALAARDWERAMTSIYTQSGARVKRGEWRTLLSWLEIIPDKVLRGDLKLYIRYATVLVVHGEIELAEAAISYIEKAAQTDAGLQGEVALFQTDLAYRRGDLAGVVEAGERALALLPTDNLEARARASMILGMAKFYRSLYAQAWSAETDAYRWGRTTGDNWVAATALTYLGLILRVQGELRRAVQIDREAIALAGYSPAAASPQVNLAHVLYEWNDLEGAAHSARLAIELGEIGGAPGARHAACFDLAHTLLAQGDEAGALAMLAKADETVRHPMITPTFRANHMARHAIFALRRDDLDSARDWTSRLSTCGAEPAVLFRHIPARVLVAQGRKAAAAEELEKLRGRAMQEGAQGVMVALCLCQALAADSAAAAVAFLTEALKKGEPEGFIRTFVDEGRLLAPLLRKALAEGITPEYTEGLLGLIETEERQRKARSEEVPSLPRKVDLLSERELEVLGLMAEDMSNQEIAAQLMISLNTAKTHVRHVFDKLDAKDRLQAVTRARELNLI